MNKYVHSLYAPRAITISQEQYRTIYPNAHAVYRIPIVFKKLSKRVEVREEIADFLVKNFPDITVSDVPVPAEVIVKPIVVEPEPEIETPDINISDRFIDESEPGEIVGTEPEPEIEAKESEVANRDKRSINPRNNKAAR